MWTGQGVFSKPVVKAVDIRARPDNAEIVHDFVDPSDNELVDGWDPYRSATGVSYEIDRGLAITIQNLTGWRGVARPIPAGDWTAVLEIDAGESPDSDRGPKLGLQFFESIDAESQAIGIFHRPGGFPVGIPGRRWAQIRYWESNVSILHGDGTYWIQDFPGFSLWFTPTLLGLVGRNQRTDTIDGDAEDNARVAPWTGYLRYFRLWEGQVRPKLGALKVY